MYDPYEQTPGCHLIRSGTESCERTGQGHCVFALYTHVSPGINKKRFIIFPSKKIFVLKRFSLIRSLGNHDEV
jgi:hypothetical protein